MSNSGGVRAWQFLRRNPAYVEAWRNREAAGPEEAAPFSLRVQPAGTLVLNLAAIAGDNRVNIAEKAAGFAISGNTSASSKPAPTSTAISKTPRIPSAA